MKNLPAQHFPDPNDLDGMTKSYAQNLHESADLNNREINQRLKDLDNQSVGLNVKAYGAVGDGVEDDSEAIRKTILAAEGDAVYFPPGTYYVTSELLFGSNVHVIFAKGAVLTLVNSNAEFSGTLDAGNYQIFDITGTGVVKFTNSSSIDKSNPQWWGAIGDGTTDDTAAIQAAIDAVATFKHTHSWQTGQYTSGGGRIYIPGRCLVTSTLTIPGGVTFFGDNPGKCGILFTPAAADTLFVGDTDHYSRDATTWWTWVKFQNLHFVSDILSAENENICFDFTLTNRWLVDNCYIEEFGTAIKNTNYSFYSTVRQSEFTNCKLVLDQGNLGGPITFLGCNMRHGATVWVGVGVQPTEFCIVGSTVTFIGTAFETGSMPLATYPTFVCIRNEYVNGGENGGCVCRGCYCESLMPFMLVDARCPYMQHSVDMVHGLARPLVKYSNFDHPLETVSSVNEYHAPVTTNYDGGTLIPLFKNPNMDYGVYDWTVPAITAYSTATNFITSRGVMDVTFATTSQVDVIDRTITAAELAPYKGRVIYFGALVKAVEITLTQLAVHIDTPGTFYKRSTRPLIDYGNDWGLYVTTIAVPEDNTSDFSFIVKATPDNIVTSDMKIAGCWAWIDGVQTVPVNETLPKIYDSSAPTTGTWNVGDVVYHSTPAAGGNMGWVCTTAGTPGTWKTFGTIQA
jgi:hypothetical protein